MKGGSNIETSSSVAKLAIRNFKVCIFGEARTGKSLLAAFLAKERVDQIAFETGDVLCESSQPDVASSYQATWGLKCHLVRQEITDSVIGKMSMNEAGALFLSRFPHYMTYLAEEADLIIYTVSLTLEPEAASKPVSDFLAGLKGTINLARQAFDEQFYDPEDPEKAQEQMR